MSLINDSAQDYATIHWSIVESFLRQLRALPSSRSLDILPDLENSKNEIFFFLSAVLL